MGMGILCPAKSPLYIGMETLCTAQKPPITYNAQYMGTETLLHCQKSPQNMCIGTLCAAKKNPTYGHRDTCRCQKPHGTFGDCCF